MGRYSSWEATDDDCKSEEGFPWGVSSQIQYYSLMTAGDSLYLDIRRKDLDVVQNVKCLGVQVDNSHDWKEQIKVLSSKV